MKQILLTIVSLLIVIVGSCQEFTNSIVRIYAYSSYNAPNASFGTGFAVKLNDKLCILTCYHVIEGSAFIEIKSKYGKLSDVQVISYDYRRDLAILSFTSKEPLLPLPIVSKENGFTSELELVGHPNNMTLQSFKGKVTSNSFISSRDFRDVLGRPIFKFTSNMDLLPVDATTYNGMSGCPVIYQKSVIGILSGSVNQGGTLLWAIPTKYIFEMKYLNMPFSDARGLSKIDFLEATSKPLIRSINLANSVKHSNFFTFYNKTSDCNNRRNEAYLNYLEEIEEILENLHQSRFTLSLDRLQRILKRHKELDEHTEQTVVQLEEIEEQCEMKEDWFIEEVERVIVDLRINPLFKDWYERNGGMLLAKVKDFNETYDSQIAESLELDEKYFKSAKKMHDWEEKELDLNSQGSIKTYIELLKDYFALEKESIKKDIDTGITLKKLLEIAIIFDEIYVEAQVYVK